MRSGWRGVADVASRRGRWVGRFAARRLWGWVRHHPWDAGLMLQVLDTARAPEVSATAARLVEDAWARGGMRGDLHRAIATYPRPFPPHPRTHPDRRAVHAYFAGDTAELRRLDPDGRVLDRALGHRQGFAEPGQRWTVDGERERLLAARDRSPGLGGGGGGGSGSSGGGGRGISGSGYGGSF